jgi:membrane protease YdiL (CAAX protease family)
MKLEEDGIRPFTATTTILLFTVPTLALFAVYYAVMPALIRAGWLPFYAYAFAFSLLFVGMIVAALIGFRLEGHQLSFTKLATRFRLNRMNRQDWLWTIGAFLAALALFFLVQPLSARIIQSGWIPLPKSLPAFLDPSVAVTAVVFDEAVGGVQGNWAFLLTSLLVLILNVVGEELWWRGYILPRQELSSGKATWLLHGILWILFHAALWWNLLNLLPLTMGLVYVASRRRSTTVGIVTHILHKTDFFLVTIPLFLSGVG